MIPGSYPLALLFVMCVIYYEESRSILDILYVVSCQDFPPRSLSVHDEKVFSVLIYTWGEQVDTSSIDLPYSLKVEG